MKRCYLCGKIIIEEEQADDHVPPKQFYPRKFRKLLNNLLKLPAHISCNKSYELDEVYFVNSLGPLAMTTKTGSALWEDIKNSAKREESHFLIQKVSSDAPAKSLMYKIKGFLKFF